MTSKIQKIANGLSVKPLKWLLSWYQLFLCALLIYPAVFIFYGQAFLPIVYPFLILLIGVIFSSISSPTSVYFMSTEDQK